MACNKHNNKKLITPDYPGVECYIINRLQRELPETNYYHNVQHTLETITAVEEFAYAMSIIGNELILLKTAALYHDTGYIETFTNNETVGAKIAKDTLGQFGYSPDQIAIVARLIMATDLTHDPIDRFEALICDADLEYLGTDRYYECAALLRRELAAQDRDFTEPEWLDFQINFLQQHRFFTPICRETREPLKEHYLQQLIKLRRKYQ